MICPKCNAQVPNGYALLRDRCNKCGADIFVFVDMIQELRREVKRADYVTQQRDEEIQTLRIEIHDLQRSVRELEDDARDASYKHG